MSARACRHYAGECWAPTPSTKSRQGQRTRRRETLLVAGQSLLLAIATVVAVLTTDADDWQPLSLFVALLALALVGQFLSVRTGDVQIGPAFIATALAMALLGPAPAAVIAVAAVLAWSRKARTPWPLVFNNVAALTTYPVVGGLLFKALGDPGADTAASSRRRRSCSPSTSRRTSSTSC